MKRVVYIVLALIIIAGAIIIPIKGFNKDFVYAKHTEVNVLLGKEYDKNEIYNIVKDVLQNKKFTINEIEVFGDAFIVKTKEISDEELDNLKNKLKEKYEIEDMSKVVTVSEVGNIRIRNIIKPYITPLCVTTLIIVAYMAVRYKKLGSANVMITELVTIFMAELAFVCVMAITRLPVNRLFVPAIMFIYTGVVVFTNVFYDKALKQKEEENKK